MNDQPPADFSGLWIVQRPFGDRIEMEYVNGEPNGVYRYWHSRGVCLREGRKKNGLWHGTLITRGATDGAVLDISEFTEGTGVYRIFNANGLLTDEIPMLNGKCHGLAKRWVHGSLVECRRYRDGKCIASTQP